MRTDWVIRPEEPADYDQIREMTLAAFAAAYGTGPAEVALMDGLRADPEAYDPALALVAARGALVLGNVMLSRVSIEGTAGRWPAVCVAPLGVRIGHQRQGIGGALLRAGLEAARARGYRIAVLEGSPAYYGRFGFEDAVPHGITDSLGGPAPYFMAAELVPGAFRGVAGEVRYPPIFAVVAPSEPPSPPPA